MRLLRTRKDTVTKVAGPDRINFAMDLFLPPKVYACEKFVHRPFGEPN